MRSPADLWRRLRDRRLTGRHKGGVPAFWRAYREDAARRVPGDTPVEEVGFVVLDTESTGLDYRADAVVSFGAVRLRAGVIDLAEAVDWRVRSHLPSPSVSIEVHGVLNRELEEGLAEREFVQRLVRYVGQAVLVGYRPGFDLALLNRIVAEHTGGRLTNPTLDVFELAMRLDYPLKPRFVHPDAYRFDRLCERFGIDASARHTAIGDAYATALLLAMLLERLREAGVRTLGDLLRPYR